MTAEPARIRSTVILDARLLVLDPDLEPLFAEVEQILCEALAPRLCARCAPVPESAPNLVSWQYYRRWRGCRPAPGRATQRGPPPRPKFPRQ
ncbi:hypothetical protein OG203_10580 [Nocardia sp. NBC_01499]|uniref:hypothetical protein n=1 Tax=Nocardia sp. NBC_01499 TaxID=2903597 RepID=UPI00386DD2C9